MHCVCVCAFAHQSQLPVVGVTGEWGNLPQISRLALGSLLSKITWCYSEEQRE